MTCWFKSIFFYRLILILITINIRIKLIITSKYIHLSTSSRSLLFPIQIYANNWHHLYANNQKAENRKKHMTLLFWQIQRAFRHNFIDWKFIEFFWTVTGWWSVDKTLKMINESHSNELANKSTVNKLILFCTDSRREQPKNANN